MFAKVRLASILVIVGKAGATIGLSMAAPIDEKPEPAGPQTKAATEQVNRPQRVSEPKVNENPKGDAVVVRGQAVDPDGNPVAGAQIVLALPQTGPTDWRSLRRLTISGADGRFEAALPRETLSLSRPNDKDRPAIGAFGPRFGPDWLKLDLEGAGKELTLRLRRDEVPIEGRIINLEGRPVRGLTVYVASLMEFPAELLKKVRENAGKPTPVLFWDEMNNAPILGKDGPIAPARTGIDGRFRLTGIGRDRAVLLLIEGEPFEQSFAVVYTSSDPAYAPPLLPANGPGQRKLFGPRFEFIIVPGRVIEGVIHDRDSGRPIRRAKVRSAIIGTATSDDQGRFRIPGQPKMPNNFIVVSIAGQPYVKFEKLIGDPPGLGPIRVDIVLKRGVWVEGTVKNRADGRPVKAIVQYRPMRDNPYLKECPDATFSDSDGSKDSEFRTDADGRFRALALPGGGMLAVRTVERDFFTAQPPSPKDADNVLPAAFADQMEQYQAMVPIDPANTEKVTIPEIVVVRRPTLQRRTQHLKVIGPDGKPVVEIRLFGNLMRNPYGRGWSGSEFTFVHTDPGKDETILVVNPDETAGTLFVVTGNEPDPISITLQPAGTVVGRLVDEEGRPRPNVPFIVIQDLKTSRGERYPGEPPTGPDGRFRISGLVAGVSYSVAAISSNTANRLMDSIGKPQWTVKPGETQEWGDVQDKKSSP